MPKLVSNLLALLGSVGLLFAAYAYGMRWLHKRCLGMKLGPLGKRWLAPLKNAGRALAKSSAVPALSARKAQVSACLACFPPLVGTLLLWADMAAPTSPWLLTHSLPGFGHDLIWHLMWYHASLLGFLSWARRVPPTYSRGASETVTVALATIPIMLVGSAGVVWLLGSTRLDTVSSGLGHVPLALMQPLGLVVVAASLWISGRRCLCQPWQRDAGWSDLFQWQYAAAPHAWLTLCQFLQQVYATGFVVALFFGGPRLFASSSWGWFLLKTMALYVALSWADVRWVSKQTKRPESVLRTLGMLGLGNLALTAALLAWRLAS